MIRLGDHENRAVRNPLVFTLLVPQLTRPKTTVHGAIFRRLVEERRCAYLILELGDALLRIVDEVSVGLLKMRLPIGSAGLA